MRDQTTGNVVELIGPEHLACYQIFFARDEQLLVICLANRRFEAWQIPLNYFLLPVIHYVTKRLSVSA